MKMHGQKGTVGVKVSKKPLQATRSTVRGLSGITPVGITGTGGHTHHGMKGTMPKMKVGNTQGHKMPESRMGPNKGHKGKGETIPSSYAFKFPQIRSAPIARGMGEIGATYPGGMLGKNLEYPPGKVTGKRSKKKDGTMGMGGGKMGSIRG